MISLRGRRRTSVRASRSNRVRQAVSPDVPAIIRLDRTAFLGRPYPADTFYQQLELFPSLTLVAEVGRTIAGYCMGSLAESGGVSWLLSLAVSPKHQRHGLGYELTQEFLRRSEGIGQREVRLSVAPSNFGAIALYARLGFYTVATAKDYLGPGEHRLIMVRTFNRQEVQSTTRLGYDPHLILGESQASIDFTNILFAVTLAVLAVSAPRLQTATPVALLLFIVVLATFYSSIFYAVVAGNVARLSRARDVYRSITYGNTFSEYFGVFLIIAAFPPLVSLVTSAALSWIAYTATSLGFIGYALSGFDMMSRSLRRRALRTTAVLLFLTTNAALLIGTVRHSEWISWSAIAASLFLVTSLSVRHLRNGEV